MKYAYGVKKNSLVFRAWFYLRNGWGQYFYTAFDTRSTNNAGKNWEFKYDAGSYMVNPRNPKWIDNNPNPGRVEARYKMYIYAP